MNSAPCCRWQAWGWLVPTAILAALPKCPVCVAVYLALGTGLGMSILTAAHLRLILIVLCPVSLASLTWRHLRRRFVRNAVPNHPRRPVVNRKRLCNPRLDFLRCAV
jgi:hypothetical protein